VGPRADFPARGPPLRLVTFDIDGTLTLGHGWERVALHVGRKREFDQAQRLIRAGKRTEDAHLEWLLDLAAGLTVREVEGLLERTPRLRHLGEAVAALRSRGIRVGLLTHNPQYVCRWYSREFGFDLYAGVLQRVRAGRILPVGPLHVDKREGLRLLLRATGVPGRQAAHVGDATPDARVFPYVGSGIALNGATSEVQRRADFLVGTRDALALLPLLERAARDRVERLPSSLGRRPQSFRCWWTRPPAPLRRS
jgi:phosphoserine phosphatase